MVSACPVDDLRPIRESAGYGNIGRRGDLGYDGLRVVVAGREYASALSTHPPASITVAVPAGMRRFSAMVAINDDVASYGSYASFTVLADGRVVADVPFVRAGSAPVPIDADIAGAGVVELRATTQAWAYCHAVWLQPTFDIQYVAAPTVITDPLLRADIHVPRDLVPMARCIVTVASAGFEVWLDDLLGSVRTFGGCPTTPIAVFSIDAAPTVAEIAARHGAFVVSCRPLRPLEPASKAVMYAAGRVIPAARLLCLDADMLVLAELEPLFAAIDACPAHSLFACGEGNDHGIADLATALDLAYGGGGDPAFFRRDSPTGRSRLVVNDGLLAGSREAFCALEAQFGRMAHVVRWVDERPDVRWRNQFAVNVAMVELGALVELDPRWNVQLHVQDVEPHGASARWRGQSVRILHFSGVGKTRYGELRQDAREAMSAQRAVRRPRQHELIGQPWRETTVPPEALAVPTMLSVGERQVLHWLARHHVTGAGRIVDGGCFLGGSTAALASGLAARSDYRFDRAVVSYDLFRVEEYTLANFGDALPQPVVGASFRSAFDHNVAPWSQHIDVREGDAVAIGWTGEPIEVLFLDMVKTWALNDLVLDQFLPCLIPGHSVIVQQDYLWGYGPWTHMVMELLAGCVRQLDSMANGSVVYLLTSELPDGVIGLRVRDLPPDRQRELMSRAVERWSGDERGLVELAQAMLTAELDGLEAGRADLRAVVARHPGDPRTLHCAATVSAHLGLSAADP